MFIIISCKCFAWNTCLCTCVCNTEEARSGCQILWTSIDGWLWASMGILGTNPGSSARTSSAINPFQLRQFKSDWLKCQSKDKGQHDNTERTSWSWWKKKNRIKTKQSISPSVPVSWIPMSIMLAVSGKCRFLEVIYPWLYQSLHILFCIDLSLVRVWQRYLIQGWVLQSLLLSQHWTTAGLWVKCYLLGEALLMRVQTYVIRNHFVAVLT